MKKYIALTLVLFASLAMAQQPDKPHDVSPEQRAAYWRAQAETLAAQQQVAKMQAKVQAEIDAMRASCGGELTADPNGEPTCKVSEAPSK